MIDPIIKMPKNNKKVLTIVSTFLRLLVSLKRLINGVRSKI